MSVEDISARVAEIEMACALTESRQKEEEALQAALRAVRESWQFRSGSTRLYEVAIEFKGQSQ